MSERRIEFPEKVRVKRLTFAQFKCEGVVTLDDETKAQCGAALSRKRVEFDHDIAAELGGAATFENCRALCKLCHRAKYPEDAAKIAQAKRREAAHLGVRTNPVKKIESPGFAKSEKAAKREPKSSLPPRAMYR